MEEKDDTFKNINTKITLIENDVLEGYISLLNLELVPLFNDIKDHLTINNIHHGSETYVHLSKLLNKKFEELKILLSSLDNKTIFSHYLKLNPTDEQINHLLSNCWTKPFTINSLSMKFLELSKSKLSLNKRISYKIEHPTKVKINQDFFLEIPSQEFTEKMIGFFDQIKEKLPCSFDRIFEDEQDQILIYKNFVYLLHLLQLGKIKYQKDTNFLYI